MTRSVEGNMEDLNSFGVPKKDNRIRIVSDFREVNMLIKRKSYPMPRIHEILEKRSD